MKQAELARLLGLTKKQVWDLEHARTIISTARFFRISRVLGLDPERLPSGSKITEPHGQMASGGVRNVLLHGGPQIRGPKSLH